MVGKVWRSDCQGRVSPAGIIQQQVGAFLQNQCSGQKWHFSGTCVPYGWMRWDPECPEPRCSSESMPQTPENGYSYVTGKIVFTWQTRIIPTNPSGDYGSTTDFSVGSRVRQFCNENHEFVKVSIPGDQIKLQLT